MLSIFNGNLSMFPAAVIQTKVLQIILSKLGPATQSGPELPWALVFKALQQMLYSMACNTTRENCGVIWDALMVSIAN